MKITDARKILGLKPGDNADALRSSLEQKLRRKKEILVNTRNKKKRLRLQDDLRKYELALRLVTKKKFNKLMKSPAAVLLLVTSCIIIGYWALTGSDKPASQFVDMETQIAELQAQGNLALAGRKWAHAEEVFQQITALNPSSEISRRGLQAVAKGKAEEANQQLFYTLGESQSALETGQFDVAERLARQVLKTQPNNETAKRNLKIISEKKRQQKISEQVVAINEALNQEQWAKSKSLLTTLRKQEPQHVQLEIFKKRIQEGLDASQKQEEEALVLFARAKNLDTGDYSADAMVLLDAARRLSPHNEDIRALSEKMGSYARAIYVPRDSVTIAEALKSAKPGDLIRIAAGTYQEAIIIDKPVRIEGAPEGKTIIELPAKKASHISINAPANGAHISQLNLKHRGFDHSKDRFSAITIAATGVSIHGCHISRAAGHGIAVLSGGSATISGVEISHCSWDGISIYGEHSRADVRDSLIEKNLHHGVNFWGGGSGSITNTSLLGNSLCGAVAMSAGTRVTISTSDCSENRQAGILVSDGVKAEIMTNRCIGNLLSGIVARGRGTTADIVGNLTERNNEAGILTYQEAEVTKFENNNSSENLGRQIWIDADL